MRLIVLRSQKLTEEKEVPVHVSEVAFFSDTCGEQNRNQYIASLLLWAFHKVDHIKIIEHKFLESGHSYMALQFQGDEV